MFESSSSGNNCHAVQRSLSGASVYECIMGFYLVPFPQPNPPTRFLSITGHWNVSLPSGASLSNGMFGRSKANIQHYFDIVAGVLQGDTLAPYMFIICLDYVLRTSIDLMKENGFKLAKEKKQKIPRTNNYGRGLRR